jgi:hypothetical protein
MPAGAAIFVGAERELHRGRSERRVPLRPRPAAVPRGAGLQGKVEETVDKTKHVNGGCRGLTSDGLSWQCYLGEEALRQRIVSEDFLGPTRSRRGTASRSSADAGGRRS